MEWPYRRFLKAFDSYQRRQACDDLRARRTAHVAALYGGQVGDQEHPLSQIVHDVEMGYAKLIADAWNGYSAEEEDDPALDTEFMRAGRRSAAAMTQRPMLPGEDILAALPE